MYRNEETIFLYHYSNKGSLYRIFSEIQTSFMSGSCWLRVSFLYVFSGLLEFSEASKKQGDSRFASQDWGQQPHALTLRSFSAYILELE